MTEMTIKAEKEEEYNDRVSLRVTKINGENISYGRLVAYKEDGTILIWGGIDSQIPIKEIIVSDNYIKIVDDDGIVIREGRPR